MRSSIINFSIPKVLERRITETINKKGFNSKAEFFRLAAINLIDLVNTPKVNEDERFNYLTKSISQEISKNYKNKKLPSVREQLDGV